MGRGAEALTSVPNGLMFYAELTQSMRSSDRTFANNQIIW